MTEPNEGAGEQSAERPAQCPPPNEQCPREVGGPNRLGCVPPKRPTAPHPPARPPDCDASPPAPAPETPPCVRPAGQWHDDCPAGRELGPQPPCDRADTAWRLRAGSALLGRCRPELHTHDDGNTSANDPDAACRGRHPNAPPAEGVPGCPEYRWPPRHPRNYDEVLVRQSLPKHTPQYQGHFYGAYSKGLPHNELGEPREDAYCALLRALDSGQPVRPGCDLGDPPAPPHARPDCLVPPPPPADPSRCDFENVPLGCPPMSRKLEDPQAAFAFALEGADSHALFIPAPPDFCSEDEAAEMAELYWMALARDVPFTRYVEDPAGVIRAAVADLNNFAYFFSGPTYRQAYGFAPEPSYSNNPPNTWWPPEQRGLPVAARASKRPLRLTRRKLFRGFTAGDQVGPYVSQLLLRDIPYGSQVIPGRIRTLDPNVNFMTSYDEWLIVQNGCDREQTNCDDVRRFIRNGRDLGQFVHVDMDFNAFYNAAFLLFWGRDPLRRCEATSGLGIEWARCLPYNNPMAPGREQFPDRPPPPPLRPGPLKSNNQLGVGTFGPQHLVPLLVYAVHLCFLAVWYQKWSVHRRIRPEEYGGRVHAQAMGWASYGVPNSLLTSALFTAHTNDPRRNVLAHNRVQNGNRRRNIDGPELCPLQPGALPTCSGNDAQGHSWLLPMEYAEGCPLHPAFGSGHATAAGACATLLKVFFTYLYPENRPEPVRVVNPVVPTDDGLALVPYTEGDADDLTIEGEINKLASNVALGRNFAGVHWRSDYTEAMRLGECIAVSLLEDQACLFQEPYTFSFRSFDGHDVTITRRSRVFACPPKPTKPCPGRQGHPGEPAGGARAETGRGEEAPAGREPQRPDREPAHEKPAAPPAGPPTPRPKRS